MSLNDLMAYVYRAGCNRSMRRAMRSARFDQLYAQANNAGMLMPRESAAITLLGEMLADRAFDNLPQKVKKSLYLWQQGIDGQRKLIDILMNSLSARAWLDARGATDLDESSAELALPHAYKSWRRGKKSPNCLGVAQMLVGIARALGAEYALVTPVHLGSTRFNQIEFDVIWHVNNVLKPYSRQNRELGTIYRAAQQSLRDCLDRRDQIMAHHALAIKLADGSWEVVDPYQRANYTLIPTGESDDWLTSTLNAPQSVATRPCRPSNEADKWERILDTRVGVLRYMLRYLDAFESKIPVSLSWAISKALAVFYHSVPDLEQDTTEYMKKLLLDEEPLSEQQLDVASAFLEMAFVSEREFSPKTVHALAKKRAPRYFKDNSYRRRHILRLIARAARIALLSLNDAEAPILNTHQSVEVSAAEYMLGVMTLNHVRHYFGAKVGGALAALCESQWALAATLSAEKGGDCIEERFTSIVESRRSRVSSLPSHLIVPVL